MKMKKSLKNFIEENIELIENEEFEVIYSDLDNVRTEVLIFPVNNSTYAI